MTIDSILQSFPATQQFSPSVHPDFERLIIGFEKLVQNLSFKGMFAYVETTFTRGYGGHAAMVWENGKRVCNAGGNINDVLRVLKIVAKPGLDEFDTLGLGRHRTTKEWKKNSNSI